MSMLRWNDAQLAAHLAKSKAPRTMVDLVLPYPPTVNRLYSGNGKGKHRNEAYSSFIEKVGQVVQQAGSPRLSGRLKLSVAFICATRRKQDISNRIKALEDALQQCGVFENDEQIDEIHARRMQETSAVGSAIVTIAKL